MDKAPTITKAFDLRSDTLNFETQENWEKACREVGFVIPVDQNFRALVRLWCYWGNWGTLVYGDYCFCGVNVRLAGNKAALGLIKEGDASYPSYRTEVLDQGTMQLPELIPATKKTSAPKLEGWVKTGIPGVYEKIELIRVS